MNRDPSSSQSPHGRADSAQVPQATYRIQFNDRFTFEDCMEQLDYLRRLGISHLYASPIFQAVPGSEHGYDTCDLGLVNPRLGGEPGLQRLAEGLRTRGMGLIVDFVPNHMGNHASNRWWWDVLELGRCSPYARFFDIEWDRSGSCFPGRVLLPVLGEPYGEALAAGKLRLHWEERRFRVGYFDHRFPVAPASYGMILEPILERLRTSGGRGGEAADLGERFLASDTGPESLDRLAAWLDSGGVEQAREEALEMFGKEPARMEGLLQAQSYRLAWWRIGNEELNYRRFFDVTSLVALRVEDPAVFEEAHRQLLACVARGWVNGIRIDHPDGLWNPAGYLDRLQERCGSRGSGDAPAGERPGPDRKPPPPAIYLVVEKILTGEEPLPASWPVHGTTGYEFLNWAGGLFVHPGHAAEMDRVYRRFTGQEAGFHELLREAKREVLAGLFQSEVERIAGEVRCLAAATLLGRDITASEARQAVIAWTAAFPTYRTYLEPERAGATPVEQAALEETFRSWEGSLPPPAPHLALFLRRLWGLAWEGLFAPKDHARAWDLLMRWQQLCGPAMAKGVEDTAFYRYHRLISLNEVGGDPARWGISPAAFHALNRRQASVHPHSLLATSTHDTKRGEDARARIHVLSEIPEAWASALQRWSAWAANWKETHRGRPVPEPAVEHLIYQALVGAWEGLPLAADFQERMERYLLKALREAKQSTSWLDPDPVYEAACCRFLQRLLNPEKENPFPGDFEQVHQPLRFFGMLNSVAQTVLKLTSPGVPDLYQGSELWDLSLVDPDNRRPVDFGLRRRLLELFEKEPAPHRLALEQWASGQIKLYVLWRGLQCRRRWRGCFERGGYEPLEGEGSHAGHLVAFRRVEGGRSVIVVVPRLACTRMEGHAVFPLGERAWGDTRLLVPQVSGRFRNIFTGRVVEPDAGWVLVASLLEEFPAAVLEPAE